MLRGYLLVGLAERELCSIPDVESYMTVLFRRVGVWMAIALLSIESVRAGEATSVPMDSWVYPALDRLAALGFIPSQIAGLRPWSRAECRRQVEEAGKNVAQRTEFQD